MLIDWFTVAAQVVNFLILVWLLKRFLYHPILDALDAREKKIAKELADADEKKSEAQKERDEFRHKNEEFEQQRATLLDTAMTEAKAERQHLLDDARLAADALSAKRQESLKAEAHNLNQAISSRARQEVFSIARKVLSDLATTDLEERLADVFTRRLGEMDEKAKIALGDALKTASDPTLVRSAFELPATQRTTIQNALNKTFSADIHLRFETAPDLISGIELSTNGQKLAWSIADYLSSLGKGVDELLNASETAKAQVAKSSELTSQIGKRAYELYEQGGHKRNSANQDWIQAEREIRKVKAKDEPRAEAKAEPKPEAKVEAKPEVKVELKPEAKAEPEVEAKAAPKPEAQIEAKPEVKVEPKPEAKAEPKAEANAEIKPEEGKSKKKGQ